ncbi:MMPL family transporter [Serinibacter arcticus]|uniref:MMPL family transporter n=1 Tax=Serinibacter arcticus TaxID=1655435 RepID=A0A2U1ZY29_9MICO|nr:MMPL family transporter [Serinibacter arcticus]PWD51897.1 MMPL family transporter [Serinibacter arcticus]
MARLLHRLGTGTHRRRVPVIIVWLLVLAGAGMGAATLSGETTTSFSLPGQESTEATEVLVREFGSSGTGTASARVVVATEDGGPLTSEANAAGVAALVDRLAGLPGVVAATDPLEAATATVSPDGSTAFSTVTYDVGTTDLTSDQRVALAEALDAGREAGLVVEMTGDAAQAEVGGHSAELIGIVVAAIVLVLTYGALGVAGMNLATALVGVGVGVLGIQIATGFLDLSASTPLLASMLGLAVGIDYALFIISRYRSELRGGADVAAAVATAVATAGSAVVTAGLTVVIALVGLFVTGIPFLAQMGVAASATIVIAVLVATTLVPACLSLLGRRALPRRERATEADTAPGPVNAPAGEQDRPAAARGRGFYRGWIGLVTRRRLPALLLSVGVLAVLAVPALDLRTTLIVAPVPDSTQDRAEELLADAFGEGFNGPLTVLYEGPGSGQDAAAAVAAIGELPGVTSVAGPVPNPTGNAALLTVLPEHGPTSAETEALVGDLRELVHAQTDGAVYVTGQTAIGVDVTRAVNEALPLYLSLVVGLAFVLLVLIFRSLVVPLLGVLGFLLSIGAALGASVAIFQWGWLSSLFQIEATGPLIALTPILMIGILFGLAMDYQIFLVSRMHEMHGRGLATTAAVQAGFRHTAPVVVAAAVIMFAVFAGFFPGADATLKSIAFALAAGIVFDAFVVRMVLVPAAMALLGERTWWLPRWLHRLPKLDVEGAELDAATTERQERGEPSLV